MTKFYIASIILFICSSFAILDGGTYPSSFDGKKISETPFGDYVKEDMPGNQIIMFVAYGCEHCWDATKEINKLKKENLLDNILILGAGSEDEKVAFKKDTETNYKMIDYDFEVMKSKIKNAEPNFPPPPFAVWVKDNIIKAIFEKMPSVKEFKKMLNS